MESPPRRRLRTRRSTGQALAAACVAGLGLALALGAGAAAAARPDVIRVGGPSAAGDAKVAVVATGGPLGSRGFRVLDRSGREVLRGRLVRAPGSPRPWRHAHLADLSAIREPGRYTVRVGALRSEPWVVTRTGSRTAIPVLLRFFAANADGAEPSPLHGPSHLNDATVESGPLAGQRVDLTGGWMDAGDTLKFTHTIAFASYVLELAARLDPADAAALHATSDVGIRWLLKAHPAPDVFIAQVGDERDHQRGFARGSRASRGAPRTPRSPATSAAAPPPRSRSRRSGPTKELAPVSSRRLASGMRPGVRRREPRRPCRGTSTRARPGRTRWPRAPSPCGGPLASRASSRMPSSTSRPRTPRPASTGTASRRSPPQTSAA
jgi:hypothetical protein